MMKNQFPNPPRGF